MATLEDRHYSKSYSGLATQTILAATIATLCITWFETMRRRRRKTKEFLETHNHETSLGSVETWRFGYLYQGRCWAQRPSPPLPRRPLGWVSQMIKFPERDILPLIGPDSTVYARFLRGAWMFVLLQTCTTLPVLLPIHLVYGAHDVPPQPLTSMERASLSSLLTTREGQELLVVHLVLLFWISSTWIATLYWVCRGAFRYRRTAVRLAANKIHEDDEKARNNPVPGNDEETRHRLRGWRLRTVMVTNVPLALRDEKLLQEYFEYYLARVKASPPTTPGLIAGVVSFVYRFAQARAAKEVEIDTKALDEEAADHRKSTRFSAFVHVPPLKAAETTREKSSPKPDDPVVIDKVVIVRKMTELASLLSRREATLRGLEEGHMQLAQTTLTEVARWIKDRPKGTKATSKFLKRMSQKETAARKASERLPKDALQDLVDEENTTEEAGTAQTTLKPETEEENERVMDELAQVLRPYLLEFGLLPKEHGSFSFARPFSSGYRKVHLDPVPEGHSREGSDESAGNGLSAAARAPPPSYPPPATGPNPLGDAIPKASDLPSIWEALYFLPRQYLDAFQPLIRLNSLFRGAVVPSIDYHTTKLGLLTALIHENRSRPPTDFIAASTAFVTFADPSDAQKVIKLLPSHPKNPIACLVTAAPEYGDLDWSRLMTKTFSGEFLKDWVVDIGVWVFTCLWILPVSLFVSLVSLSNLSTLWPALKIFISNNPIKANILTDLVPVLLVTGLSILVPLILLLISKKAHNIVLLSRLHDQIMTRYHKFLVCNVLIFFCVGTSTVSGFLTSFKTHVNILPVVGQSFPAAAPFYVGWMIFQTAMHAGLELGLLGLPLIVYPATVLHAKTPRRRKAGTRPRTFNFYYWLPNHLIVLFVVFTFSLLNPLVIPFALLYFSVANVVFRHQFIHVYSKAYEMNAKVLIIRMVRYSLDGIILAQFVFFALTIIEKKTVLAAFNGLFIAITTAVKLYLTGLCRANFALDDINEAKLICEPPEVVAAQHEEMRREAEARQELEQVAGVPLINEPPHEDNREDRRASLTNRLNNLVGRNESRLSDRPVSDQHGHHNPIRFWTWKPPSGGVQFAYSTLPARLRHSERPNQVDTRPGLGGINGSERESDLQAVPSSPGAADLADPQPAIYTDPFRPKPEGHKLSWADLGMARKPELVQVHERRQPWDDAPRYDLTYENPHYTRPIDNILWLPVNPCDILDLDNTVDVFRALTSEPGAGALGQWINESSSIMAEPAETRRLMDPSEDFHEDEQVIEVPLSGMETIALPSSIEARLETADNIHSAEIPDSPMLSVRPPLTRRLSSTPSTDSSTHPGQGGRSFSAGTVASMHRSTSRTLRPKSSRMSAITTSENTLGLGLPNNPPTTPRNSRVMSGPAGSRIRSGSITASHYSTAPPFDPSHHVDLGSQAVFADPNFGILLRTPSRIISDSPEELQREDGALSPLSSPVAERRTSLHVPGHRASGFLGRARSNSRFSVTTREAVVGEVLAEEQIATAERVKKETEESEQAGAPRTWLTSWLYNSLHHDEAGPVDPVHDDSHDD